MEHSSQIVLVAEDESIVANFVSTALEREGFTVLIAPNPEEALRIFHDQAVDLLLTDLQMGAGISGIELAERIEEEKPGTKVLVMSGIPEKELTATVKRLPFLRKPFTPAILTDAVREVLGSKNDQNMIGQV